MPVTGIRRRFEFIEGTSSKFWELEVNGVQVTVRFGRIGTAGQSETKTFQNAEAAAKHADQKSREKLRKGYRELS